MLADWEARLAKLPVITVPSIAMDGHSDGVVAAGGSSGHRQKFGATHTRIDLPGIGHNLSQEAPAAFVNAVLRRVGEACHTKGMLRAHAVRDQLVGRISAWASETNSPTETSWARLCKSKVPLKPCFSKYGPSVWRKSLRRWLNAVCTSGSRTELLAKAGVASGTMRTTALCTLGGGVKFSGPTASTFSIR